MRKLFLCLIFTGWIMIYSQTAESQILHTVLNKSLYLPGSWHIDLANIGGGHTDYTLWNVEENGTQKFRISCFDSNNMQVIVSSDSIVKPFNLGDSISGTCGIWTSNKGNWMILSEVGSINKGSWPSGTPAFIAMRTQSFSGHWHYAWVQVTFNSGNGFNVIDQAYNNTENNSLTAGQTVGIQPAVRLENTVYSYNKRLFINLDKGTVNYCTFKIYDILGNEVFSRTVSGSSEYDLSAVKDGIYIVRLQTNNGLSSYKISLM